MQLQPRDFDHNLDYNEDYQDNNSERSSSPDPLAINSEDEIWALSTQSEPTTFKQAICSPDAHPWKLAIKDELDKMDKYQVWTVIPRTSQRVITAKWVFTRKIDGKTGNPSNYKARWVARGFTQREGIDYTDLFSSVTHKDTLRFSTISTISIICLPWLVSAMQTGLG